jgi:hypothetical protein
MLYPLQKRCASRTLGNRRSQPISSKTSKSRGSGQHSCVLYGPGDRSRRPAFAHRYRNIVRSTPRGCQRRRWRQAT